MINRDSKASGEPADRPEPPRRQDLGPWVRRALVFVLCALAMNALIGERGLAETLRARQQLREAAAQLNQLKRENANLFKLAGALQSDRRTIENIARAELGLLRKGEVLVVVRDVPAR
jgi:cell division protein FtsB